MIYVRSLILFCFAVFSVSVALAGTCSIYPTGMVFPPYIANSGNTDGIGDIAVTCTAPSAEMENYSIALNAGNGTYSQRALMAGATILQYNIYTTADRTTVWGDGYRDHANGVR